MKARKMFRTVETHTLGHPTRNVVSGFRHIPGKTMTEKFTYMKENEDWFVKSWLTNLAGAEIMSCHHHHGALYPWYGCRRPLF